MSKCNYFDLNSALDPLGEMRKECETGLTDVQYNTLLDVFNKVVVLAGIESKIIDRLREDTTYFRAPASPMKWCYHSNFEGGLLIHSLFVVKQLLNLDTAYPNWEGKWESAVKIGLFHDMCKAVYNRPPDYYHKTWWYDKPMYPGHAECSIAVLPTLGILLNEEETVSIRWHMGAYNEDKQSLSYYEKAKRRYPKSVLCTHWADMAAGNFCEWTATPVPEEEE